MANKLEIYKFQVKIIYNIIHAPAKDCNFFIISPMNFKSQTHACGHLCTCHMGIHARVLWAFMHMQSCHMKIIYKNQIKPNDE